MSQTKFHFRIFTCFEVRKKFTSTFMSRQWEDFPIFTNFFQFVPSYFDSPQQGYHQLHEDTLHISTETKILTKTIAKNSNHATLTQVATIEAQPSCDFTPGLAPQRLFSSSNIEHSFLLLSGSFFPFFLSHGPERSAEEEERWKSRECKKRGWTLELLLKRGGNIRLWYKNIIILLAIPYLSVFRRLSVRRARVSASRSPLRVVSPPFFPPRLAFGV